MNLAGVPTIYAEDFFRRNAELFAPHLADVGLDAQILSAPETEIPLAKYVALWELVGHQVDASIALRIAMQTDSSAFGAYGHALRSAPNMQLVLRSLSHFFVTVSDATRVEVACESQQVSVCYQITDPRIVLRRQDAEFSIGMVLSLLREVTGNPQLVPLRMDFEHAAPTDLTLHREVFKCALYFNQPDNRAYFSLDLLNMPVRTGDPRLFKALEGFLETQRQSRAVSNDLLGMLGKHIASSLSSGGASLAVVAKSMGVGPRTLQRCLARQQVAFGELVEDVRRSLAEYYLKRTEHSIIDIALLLGYAEASSFSRAFRRWTELSPQHYRQEHAQCGRSAQASRLHG